MGASNSLPARAGSIIVSTLILLLPALWNRFPLLEYDTGGYLARWFEGYLVPSRSTTYGLFLASGWPLDFWPVIVLQALAAVWIIALFLRTHRFPAYPFALPVIVWALSATTALPWLASELLTDIFAGLAVLALHMLVWDRDQLAKAERLGLFLFIGFAGSTHSATFAVLLCLGAVALGFSWTRPQSGNTLPRTALASMAAAIALGAVLLLAGNYIVSRTFAWTPGGYGIAFGRMLQDGIVEQYLDDHCPDPHLRLCPYRKQLPRDADDFLWGQSVFDRLGRFAGLGDEMRTIVLGSLRDYPVTQIKAALVATAKQIRAVGTGEGVVASMWHTFAIIERYTPSAVPAMRAARQQHGEIRFSAINDIDKPVAWLAIAFLPVLFLLGMRQAAFIDLAQFAATAILALAANAAFCGVISNPHDRYGSRIVWIAVFAGFLAAWRAVILAQEGARPLLKDEGAAVI
jgi:hypothetical protein